MPESLSQINIHQGTFKLKVELPVPDKNILGIWGPSGSGKTSLLRTVAGLEAHQDSMVIINGQTLQSPEVFIQPENRRLAFVFQDQQLFPHLSVAQNLQFSCQRGVHSQQRQQLAFAEVIEALAVSHLLNRSPHELSGGEQQRVALARGVLRNPDLMLLDEPMASLDHQSQLKLIPYLRMINRHFKIPMIYVSHHLDEMLALCDDLLVLNPQQGHFCGCINAAMRHTKAGLLTHPLTGCVLESQVIQQDVKYGLMQVQTSGGLKMWVKGLHEMGTYQRLIIAANDVSLSLQQPVKSSVLNVIEARVSTVIKSDDYDFLVVLHAAQETLMARISTKSFDTLALEPEQKVFAQVKTQAVQSFQ